MFSKVHLLLAIFLLRVSSIRTQNSTGFGRQLESIQNDMFEKLSSHLQATWNGTASGRENIYFFPMLMRIRKYMLMMKSFYEDGLIDYYPRDSYLQNAYELARIRDRLEQSPKIDVKFKIALFYDPRYLSKLYLNDSKLHYHPEMYEIHFTEENKRKLTKLLDSWTRNNTKGRTQKHENFRWRRADNYHASQFCFNGCWNMPKNYIESMETNPRRRRSVPAMPTVMRLNFTRTTEIFDVSAFSAKERVGYYDNRKKHYEAIKLPFRNGDFAMAVVLPYENYTTEIFTNFTVADYRQLFRQLNSTHKHINYTIPIINSTTFLINEIGISINEGDLCGRSLTSEILVEKIAYKPFFVNRPFGIFIYHEPTSFILMHGSVRNPASNLWHDPKFQVTLRGMVGDELKIEHFT